MRRVIRLVSLFAALSLMAACGGGSDGGRGDDPSEPGSSGGNRPGIGSEADLSEELADEVYRLTGDGISLRFDAGGVLLREFPDGRVRIVDIETNRFAEILVGTVDADSVCRSAALTIDGRNISGLTVKMKKKTATAVWYHITPTSSTPSTPNPASKTYILVLP